MNHDLQFIDVHKNRRQNGGGSVRVFSGLNLTVPAGGHLAVVGGSGVGKTTLLRLANRLDDPDSGTILFAGEDLRSLEVTDHRQSVSLVLQKPCLPSSNLVEAVFYPDILRHRTPDPEFAREQLLFVGIDENLLGRDGTSLSMGQQQRVCLARALYCRPKLLMMDETTSSLDPRLALEVLQRLIERSQQTGMTLLHVTHEMGKIKLADTVVLLGDGGVAERTTPEQFLADPQSEAGRRFLGK